ncbi:type II toxin-antitoxin system HipA family toxin [Hyalangium rubrum]|uniref:Type II toxin-antitoxin system HipA family toxin n=1 Tax=Hyalangium rubrum TaxID=3103134 RepID=A0ABU5GYI5_9BACT|nr:type II toxin-antitoxin system HipA family toxin [Hyalangium sp. s54d21]MDY7226248.1 type II toxin-antitoxin system HipA family toxin [Hyalangium sp. s54d21]
MSKEQTLDVFLNELLVGELREEQNGRTAFRFTAEYLEQSPRPVMSQSFLDDPGATYAGKLYALPSFFSNLLPDPDGHLRGLIAHQLGVKRHHEFALISALGEDLPGAVVLRARQPLMHSAAEEVEPARPREQGVMRFSLAGAQLKFSMVRQGKRLTYPSGGRGGNVIVKLPDPDIPYVPENEYSMMCWAGACGIDVPEVELLPMERVEGLPPSVARTSGYAYVIQRFDRPKEGGRIHIEDMAQVFDLPPEKKDEERHYQHIGRLLVTLPDLHGFEQFVRRLVFMMASGNSDAHLKNWSLVYPDGVHAQLSPAYDLVSTQVYERFRSARFSQKLVRIREYREVNLPAFRHFAEKSGASPDEVERIVLEMVDRIRDEWRTLRTDLPMPDSFKAAIEDHWKEVPLLSTRS